MSISIHVGRHDKANLTDSILNTFKLFKGSDCAQVFTHGPHSQKMNSFDPDILKKIASLHNIYAHSTYRTSWVKNFEHLQDQFTVAGALGLKGVVLHLGKLSPAEHIAVLDKLKIPKGVKIILEMRALKPDKWTYQTPDEVNALCKALDEAKYSPDEAIICLDTAHINAAKIKLNSKVDAKRYMDALRYPDYIGLLHLNGNAYDSSVRAGDKHTIPESKSDFVFTDKIDKDSGAVYIASWFLSRKRDVILELDVSDELVTFYNKLSAACL